MQTDFSPSVNIKRDSESNYLYIPTKNSLEAYNTIASNFKSGIHSYNLIGSYGTGKSSFLLAFSKHLKREEEYFYPLNGQFNGCSKFKFIQIVGEYESLITSLAKELGVEDSESIVYESIKELQKKLKKKNQCLVLVVDEFGKTLEYSAKHNPEKELYFIQKLTEYANDKKRNLLFLSTLHQNFDAYAIGLNDKDRKEWEKVKGRIKELPFNEPVEQMLELAGQALSLVIKDKNKVHLTKKFLSLIKKSNLFKLRNDLTFESAKRLFPLEPLSASCLLVALQRYGQNERSLFNFISSKEPFGLHEFLKIGDSSFYSIVEVYDYLIHNYSYVLQSKNNPDFFKWRVLITALDRVDALLETNQDIAKEVIKIIGLLNLINQNGSKINLDFLTQYFKEVLCIKKIEPILNQLANKGILKYHKFKDSYSIYEGSDIDIEFEIESKRKELGSITSIENEIANHIDLKYIVAKAISYKKGTPRIFKYTITTKPLISFDAISSEIDGIINIVLTTSGRVPKNFTNKNKAIAHCFIKAGSSFKNQLFDIDVIEKILVENTLDKVARQELVEYKDSLLGSFTNYFKEQLFSNKSKWYINNVIRSFKTDKELNKALTEIIEGVYSDTPIFRNELINRTKLPGTIQHAKKLFISALLNNWEKSSLGYSSDKFPPDRTIYHSLLEDTGIHKSDSKTGLASFEKPTDKSFRKLWKAGLKFLESSKKGKRSLSEFISILQQKPFKLKDGFIEFWIISFLFIHREEFALYVDGSYIPIYTPEVCDLMFKKAKSYHIKAIEVDGIRLSLFNKYRELINRGSTNKLSSKGFQEIAKPFLTFYKQLSVYSKQTKQSLSKESIALRGILLNAKELEKTFFEDLPTCFGFTLTQLEKDKKKLDVFAKKLQKSIRELRLLDTKLIERITKALQTRFESEEIKLELFRTMVQDRYSSDMEHLLDAKQKSLLQRIHSQIPEHDLWVSSIVQALIGKPLNKISDKEEALVLHEIKKQFNDLDALLEIVNLDFDQQNELALRYEIQGSDKKRKNNQIILNKSEIKQISKMKKELFKKINKLDIKVREGLLLEMLKEIKK